jgi:hypothetical protein
MSMSASVILEDLTWQQMATASLSALCPAWAVLTEAARGSGVRQAGTLSLGQQARLCRALSTASTNCPAPTHHYSSLHVSATSLPRWRALIVEGNRDSIQPVYRLVCTVMWQGVMGWCISLKEISPPVEGVPMPESSKALHSLPDSALTLGACMMASACAPPAWSCPQLSNTLCIPPSLLLAAAPCISTSSALTHRKYPMQDAMRSLRLSNDLKSSEFQTWHIILQKLQISSPCR